MTVREQILKTLKGFNRHLTENLIAHWVVRELDGVTEAEVKQVLEELAGEGLLKKGTITLTTFEITTPAEQLAQAAQ